MRWTPAENGDAEFLRRWILWAALLFLLGLWTPEAAGAFAETTPSGNSPEAAVRIPDAPPQRSWRPLKKERRAAKRFLFRSTNALRGGVTRFIAKERRLLPSATFLPETLAGRAHGDYAPAFKWIPRSWTTFNWGKPRMILGNQGAEEDGSPKPIGEPGSFQISRYPSLPPPLCWLPLYISCTTPGGIHFRVGARWDDVDSYTNLPSLAIKKLN